MTYVKYSDSCGYRFDDLFIINYDPLLSMF